VDGERKACGPFVLGALQSYWHVWWVYCND